MPILNLQRRLVEVGRIRLGEKSDSGAPKKLSTFRFTSASRDLLQRVADIYGGDVTEWKDAPDAGYFELHSKASEIDVVIPAIPSAISQYYELWSGGGCKRRCDEETELISGKGCLCDPDDRECKPVTRINVMLPQLGVGVWRLETQGWNAATTLPTTVELATQSGKMQLATLRLEQRSAMVDKKKKRFVVPVLDLKASVVELLEQTSGARALPSGPVGLPVAPEARVPRPQIPAAIEPPPQGAAWAEPGAEPARAPDIRRRSGDKVSEGRLQAVIDALAKRGRKPVDDVLEKWVGAIEKLHPTDKAVLDAHVASLGSPSEPAGVKTFATLRSELQALAARHAPQADVSRWIVENGDSMDGVTDHDEVAELEALLKLVQLRSKAVKT